MATSITTQADILTYVVIPDNELFRLQTERMKADNWAAMHAKAWTLVKDYLLARHPSVEEADLDDPTELKRATCYAVIYLAYEEAQMLSDEDQKRKQMWFKRFRKAMAQADITSDSAVLPRESYGSRRAGRA